MLRPVKRAIRKALHAAGYAVVPLPERIHEGPRRDGAVLKPVGRSAPVKVPGLSAPTTPVPTATVFAEVAAQLDRIEPWSGDVPAG